MNVFSKLLDSIDNYLARQENRQVEAFLSQAQNLGSAFFFSSSFLALLVE